MPLWSLDATRRPSPSSGYEIMGGTHRQSGSTAKGAVAYKIQKEETFRGRYPRRRRTRNVGALLCALGLGILALVPFLGSLRPWASTGSQIHSRAASPATDLAKRGTGGSGRSPSGHNPEGTLSPEEVAGELLSDGRPRCFEDEEELQRCLPTVFFLGVSKCVEEEVQVGCAECKGTIVREEERPTFISTVPSFGCSADTSASSIPRTTSLSNWLAKHPRIRFAPPSEGHDFRETHLFDFSPKLWHGTKALVRRAKIASVAEPRDTVIDFTPHYSIMAETPLRIADFYGEGLLRSRGLRFLVLLREPVARTISSWEYKSDPYNDTMANAGKDSTMSTQEEQRSPGVERRTLQNVVSEGVERVNRLADCVATATEMKLFGREPKVTYCRKSKGKKQCGGHPPCEICNSHTEPWCNPRTFLEDHMYNAHVGKSVYAMQLKQWFDVFGQDNFKVIFTETMAEDPLGTLKEVLDFLSLNVVDPKGVTGLRSEEEWAGVVGARYNTADWKKKKKLDLQITPQVIKSMQDFFAPHNKALEDMLGVSLPSSWRDQAAAPL